MLPSLGRGGFLLLLTFLTPPGRRRNEALSRISVAFVVIVVAIVFRISVIVN